MSKISIKNLDLYYSDFKACLLYTSGVWEIIDELCGGHTCQPRGGSSDYGHVPGGDRVLTSGAIDFKIAYRVPGREKKIREYI